MKVAALYGRHDIRIEEWKTPTPGPGQVLIKVACCGICGTEVHFWEGFDAARFKMQPATGPRVWGHEFAGIVAEVGDGVTICKVGDRVTVIPYLPCGKCFFCRNGNENFCTDKTTIYEGGNGAFAEYTLVPEELVYPIPDDMSLEVASLSEPLSCCVHAVDRASIQSGSSVCIIGAGPVGLMLLALARAGGAAQVVVSEPASVRRKLAVEMGADMVVNPLEEDLLEVVRSVTRGLGVDYSFEAVGKAATAQQAIDIVRNAGTVTIMGVANPDDLMPISPFELFSRELTVMGSIRALGRSYSYDRTVRWLAALDFKPLLTHTFELDEIATAIKYAQEGKGGKILVEP